MDYIPIESVDDLDPAKISIRDINKRYIDRDGKRYGTRFNLETKRVEVVRLFKNKAEAMRASQEIQKEKRNERLQDLKQRFQSAREALGDEEKADESLNAGGMHDAEDDHSLELDDLELGGDDDGHPDIGKVDHGKPMARRVFIEQQCADDIANNLEKVRERHQILMKNLRNTLLWEGSRAAELTDLQRDLDVSVWQKNLEAVNYFKELYGYPRSVTHYMLRLSDSQKGMLEHLEDDQRKMEMIRRWEARRAFEESIKTTREKTEEIRKMVEAVDDETRRGMAANERKELEDAAVSAGILIDECDEMLADIQHWKRQHP